MKIAFDLDDTLAKYTEHRKTYCPTIKYPQSLYGFYEEMKPVIQAVAIYQRLSNLGHTVYIATAPSVLNTCTYTDKARWVECHLGTEALNNLIIISDKSLLDVDVLIDDNVEGKGQENFKGLLIHSPLGCDWFSILDEVLAHQTKGTKLCQQKLK